jgi:hypothetical protein
MLDILSTPATVKLIAGVVWEIPKMDDKKKPPVTLTDDAISSKRVLTRRSLLGSLGIGAGVATIALLGSTTPASADRVKVRRYRDNDPGDRSTVRQYRDGDPIQSDSAKVRRYRDQDPGDRSTVSRFRDRD